MRAYTLGRNELVSTRRDNGIVFVRTFAWAQLITIRMPPLIPARGQCARVLSLPSAGAVFSLDHIPLVLSGEALEK